MGDNAVNLTDREGRSIAVSPEDVAAFIARGYHHETPEERTEQLSKESLQQNYGGIGGAIEAGEAGLLRGATLGLSDVAGRAFGSGHDLQMLQEANPGISTAANIAGAIAPILLTGGAAAPESIAGRLLEASPTSIASRVGQRVAGLGEGAGFLGKTGAIAGGAATEGAIQNAGGYISDVALGNRDLSAEGFLGAMGQGALYGGVAGGALSVASHGLIAARKLFPIEDVSPASVARAEAEARQAVKSSVETSKGLEQAGKDAAVKIEQETKQIAADFELSRQHNELVNAFEQRGAMTNRVGQPPSEGGYFKPLGPAESVSTAGQPPFSLSNAPSEQPGYGAAPAPAGRATPQTSEDMISKLMQTKQELEGGATMADLRARAIEPSPIQPVLDARKLTTDQLLDRLRELTESRDDMLGALGKGEATESAVAKAPQSIGERILEGVKPQVDADAAVEAALGKSKNVNADIAEVAPKITRYEAAKANLTEALGDSAPADAKAHAAAYREAEAKASAANAKNTATQAENVDTATSRDVPADKLPGGNPRLGGFKQALGKASEVAEMLHSFGIPIPGLHSIPIIGPILSTFLKAKVLGKVLSGHGGSFAATAEGTIAAKSSALQNKINTAIGNTLEAAGKKVAATAPTTGAVAALGYKLFDDGKQTKPYSSKPAQGDLEKLYADRLGELSAAMQPGAIDREVRARVNTSDPTLLDAIVAAETKRLQYLFNLAPKPNEQWPGQPPQSPSKQEMLDFGHVLAAFHDPTIPFQKVAAGDTARPSEVACVQNCYPQIYAAAVAKFVEKYTKGGPNPSYQHQMAISMLYGIPMGPSMTPDYAAFLKGPAPATMPPAAPIGKPLSSSIGLGQRSLTRLDR